MDIRKKQISFILIIYFQEHLTTIFHYIKEIETKKKVNFKLYYIYNKILNKLLIDDNIKFYFYEEYEHYNKISKKLIY